MFMFIFHKYNINKFQLNIKLYNCTYWTAMDDWQTTTAGFAAWAPESFEEQTLNSPV